MSESEKVIVNRLKENELAMKDLYLVFSEKFATQEAFWRGIAEEEASHAAWIDTLYIKMGAGLIEFSEKRFPVEAVRANIENMKDLQVKAKKGELSLLEALEKSVHIEHGMLENRFFEVFKDDSPELKIILDALRVGTETHFHEMENAWKKERN
jgi:rubrerythrin